VISADCDARRCSGGHALAGIAIATMTSLCHRPTTDSVTDVVTLVRRALAEVCTVQVLLVISVITADLDSSAAQTDHSLHWPGFVRKFSHSFSSSLIFYCK